MIVLIMRKAVLMEDEGRETPIKQCESRSEARQWIKDQEGKYFGPGDYYIMEPVL